MNSNLSNPLVAPLTPPGDQNALDSPRWEVTFIGGTADLLETAVPEQNADLPHGARLPLAMAAAGAQVWVAQIKGGHQLARRLMDVGIVPGRAITLVSRTDSGSVIVALQGCRIGLGAGMAHRVMVAKAPPPHLGQTAPQRPDLAQLSPPPPAASTPAPATTTTAVSLGSLAVGQQGRILGYQKGQRAYREKLLSMGLTPGTPFTVTRQAPMGDPIELSLRGFKLSLRKGEAAALQVETCTAQEVSHD